MLLAGANPDEREFRNSVNAAIERNRESLKVLLVEVALPRFMHITDCLASTSAYAGRTARSLCASRPLSLT